MSNVTQADKEPHLKTNGSILNMTTRATVPQYGGLLFENRAITNILSFTEIEDKYQITYDSAKQKGFVVHPPDHQVRFHRCQSGLYYFKPNYETKLEEDRACHCINTVQENAKFHTKHQVDQEKKA